MRFMNVSIVKRLLSMQFPSLMDGYLFMVLSQEQNDKCRLRNNIFPDKDCVVYVKSLECLLE